MKASRSIPTISVGMPVLNGEASVSRAIDGLLAQTFTDFEIIVCDNASDDRTPDIVRAIGARDPRVKLRRFDERVDIRLSFKRALDETEGPFFMFAPADDRWYPEFMEECLSALRSDSSLVAATGRVAFFSDDGRFSHISRGTAPLTGRIEENLALFLRDPGENARAFSLIRREATVDCFPDATYPGWDFQMTARMLTHGGFGEVPKVLSERHVTTRETYIRQAERWFGNRLLTSVPLNRAAFEILRDKQVPDVPGKRRALANLAWRSHLNYAEHRMPRWHAMLSRIGGLMTINDPDKVIRQLPLVRRDRS